MDAIKFAIKCTECLGFLVKPVTLPCGSSVCYKHLETLDNGTFFCKLCHEEHQIEKSYINVNKALEVLIQANLKNVNLGPEYNAAFNECSILEQIVNEMKTLTSDPHIFVKKTIDQLKNKTELFRERHKLKIDEKANEIIELLDNYEQECKGYIDSCALRTKIEKIDKKINKIKVCLADLKNSLNNFATNVDQWKTIRELGIYSNLRFKSQLSDFKRDILLQKLDLYITHVLDFEQIEIKPETRIDEDLRELKEISQKLDIINSRIITKMDIETLWKLCDFSSDKKSKLIYRASDHGFTASDFHEKCDNVANTMTIIKSTNGHVFGGFTSLVWDQSNTYKNDQDAFLFSLVNAENEPEIIRITNPSYAIYCKQDFGPTFGSVSNVEHLYLIISFDSNNYSILGYSYPKPFICIESKKENSVESQYFTISDMEVYQIV